MSLHNFDKIRKLFQELEYTYEDKQNDVDALYKELRRCEEDITSLGNENDKLRADIELLTRELEEAGEALRRFGELHG